jgi:hypothetical protein
VNAIEELIDYVLSRIEEQHIRNELIREINNITNYGNIIIKRISLCNIDIGEAKYIPP